MTAEMKPLDLTQFVTWAWGPGLYLGCGVNECEWEHDWNTVDDTPTLNDVLNAAIQHTVAAHM